MANWKVEQSGRFTVTSAVFESLNDADNAVKQFIAAATNDPEIQLGLFSKVMLAEPGETVTLPNGKRLELIDLGEQF
jgi:hypothetical protein